ncbi:hypothetical protein FN846DRAFT_910757 [Sphaerosporella brunnea]|uniref:Uncharacterized protein n=1 Tax=Sphaerosporella brunnea TaxID=1250544 RepID=A0A5J5EMT7_9PEZI|nr:hypothetical protein FN846DRAFT_910757 [Sphaerosporella brunnea]
MTPQEHIQCAAHAVDAEYRLLGPTSSNRSAIWPLLSMWLGVEQGAEHVFAWFARWRQHEIRRAEIQDTDKPARWFRVVKRLLAPMRPGWRPGDRDDDEWEFYRYAGHGCVESTSMVNVAIELMHEAMGAPAHGGGLQPLLGAHRPRTALGWLLKLRGVPERPTGTPRGGEWMMEPFPADRPLLTLQLTLLTMNKPRLYEHYPGRLYALDDGYAAL